MAVADAVADTAGEAGRERSDAPVVPPDRDGLSERARIIADALAARSKHSSDKATDNDRFTRVPLGDLLRSTSSRPPRRL